MIFLKRLLSCAVFPVTICSLFTLIVVPATIADQPAHLLSKMARGDHPLKVFILAGQSNMQGHAKISTFEYLTDDPATAPLLKEMRVADGRPRVCDNVWISSVGCAGDGWSEVIEQTGKLTAGFGASREKIGPEFTFGIEMEKRLGGPILIIKAAWGGRSLSRDFRPPSAGPMKFDDVVMEQWQKRGIDSKQKLIENNAQAGVFYRHMIEHVRMVLADIKRIVPDYDPDQGYELAGFVWFQGFNDMVDSSTYPNRMEAGGYDQYGALLAHLIRDVRQDLSAPQMPFVVGVMGVGGIEAGKQAPQLHFRQAQASVSSLPEFKGNVAIVFTEEFWDESLAAIQTKREQVSQMVHLLRTKNQHEANKNGTMTEAQQRDYVKKFEAELIPPDEAALFERGASNAGYHYLGCAKTFARMGKAFADTLLDLKPPTIDVE